MHLIPLSLLLPHQFTEILGKVWTYHDESNLRQTEAFASELEEVIQQFNQVSVSGAVICCCHYCSKIMCHHTTSLLPSPPPLSSPPLPLSHKGHLQ